MVRKCRWLFVFSLLWHTLAFAGVGYSSYYTGADYNIELQYKVENNVNAVIIGCMLRRSDPDEKNTTVQIPSKIGSCKVVRIEAGAFSGGTHWKSIKIPTSVTSIGNGAFRGCTRLKSITVPNSVETIGNSAFRECVGLESVNVGSSVKDADIEIGDYAFCDCTSLKTVTLHNGVMSMGTWAFSGCSSLSTISMPSSVVRIGERAFQGCENASVHVADICAWCKVCQGFGAMPYAWDLYVDGVKVVDLVLPDGLISVGCNAFAYCESIKSLEVPSSVTSIEEEAFMLTGLKNVKFLGATPPTFGKNVFSGIEGLTVGVFEQKGWTSVFGSDKWLGAVDVKWVQHVEFIVEAGELVGYVGDLPPVLVLPEGITKIGDCVFEHTSIKEVIIPPSVTYIGSWAFVSCGDLVSVTLPPNVTYIGDYAFSYCESLASMTIPSSVTHIGFDAFSRCSNLESVLIQPGVSSGIASGMFSMCRNLVSVTIPSSITVIGNNAFDGCEALTSVDIPENLTWIGDYAFAGSGLTSVKISAGVAYIGEAPFSGCKNLMSICVSSGNEKFCLRDGVLYNLNETELVYCPCGLNSVSIPSSVKSIRNRAFFESGLTSVTIPSSVTSIGERAFGYCGGLTSVTIPSSVTSIGGQAFCGCGGMRSFDVDANNPSYKSENGLLLTKDGKTLIAGVNGEVVIPEGVTGIGDGAFGYCGGLTSVTIPSSVTSIGVWIWPFSGCGGIRSFNVDVNNPSYKSVNGLLLTKDGKTLIAGVNGEVVIPEGVTRITREGFRGCSGLASVTIPLSVMSIVDRAFDDTGIDNVYVNKGDVERVRGLYDWPDGAKFIEIACPIVVGDEGATVTGDAESGFVIKPSEGKTTVEVTIPQGVDAAKVTVEVSVKVTSVKPNGAKVKIVSGGADITEWLDIPGTTRGDDGGVVATQPGGVIDLTKATVKEEIVKEAMDPAKGAEIKLDAANPSLITPNTRIGLFYTFSEGRTLGGMERSASKTGDGKPWSPEVKVKGGNSAFYSIGVGKGE